MRSRVRHELKTWPEFFEATKRAHKRFELRRDDRPEGFQVGDELLLKEWDPATEAVATPLRAGDGPGKECARIKGYTGREVLVRVDYIMPADTVAALMGYEAAPPGFPGCFVIMSVSLVN